MKVYFLIITAITFTLFFSEALIHFNIGRIANGKPRKDKYIRLGDHVRIHVPDKDEFFKISITVLIFSSISGFISAYIIKKHFSNRQ
jgi:hypothetical protein